VLLLQMAADGFGFIRRDGLNDQGAPGALLLAPSGSRHR
jgi:hypothetical protein